MAERHWRLTYRLPAALEDEWVAALWSAGTTGLQTLPAASDGAGADAVSESEIRLEAWFSEPPEVVTPHLDPAAWRTRGVHQESAEEVAPRDWLAEWRRQARPLAIGERFMLDPREPEEAGSEEAARAAAGAQQAETDAGRTVLRLPARNAFGTGSHESTRLAIELLEDEPPTGLRVLDVGTGTGVLAFAALALGARRVVGFDLDPASAVHARANAGLNGAVIERERFACFAGETAALRPAARFDQALVNVLPGRILSALPAIAARLRPGGGLLFSGIVAEVEGSVLERCREVGLREIARRREGEWVAFRFRLDEGR